MTEPTTSHREGDPIDGVHANTVDVQRFATRKNVVRVNAN
jgi:hypothetical protein